MKRWVNLILLVAIALYLPPSAAAALTDNGNGTVTDAGTGLIWQQGEPGAMTWGNALSYCEGLSLGGHSDWRLPNVNELESLTDDSRYNPAINTSFFPNANSSDYWSSTTYAYGPNSAWSVYFYYGYVSHYSKGNYNYVRCVRGGQYGSLGSLTISPSSLSFPATWPGSGTSGSLTVSNGLSTAVTTGTAMLSGVNPSDFSLLDSCAGQTLNRYGSCSVTVNFTPATCGSKSATLTVPTSQGNLSATLDGPACGAGSATLSGQVTDGATGLPLAGATVMVGANGPFVTDAGGNYLASGLASGPQDMVTSKSGYDTWRVAVSPSPLQTIRKNVYLNPAATGLRVVSVTSSYSSGKPYYFLPGVSFDVTFTAQVNWNGKTPGKVRFITPRGSYDVATSGDTAKKTFNVGTEFDSCATLQAVAIAANGNTSPAKNADFIVTKALPVDPTIPVLTNNLSVENTSGVNGSSFKYINNSTLSKNMLDQTIGDYKDMPILGAATTALQFVPEFDFEFSGSDGKLSYNLSLLKNSDYASIATSEYSRRKNPNGLKNLTRLITSKFDRRSLPSARIAGFELTLFPMVSLEAQFNPASCGTSSNGWESVEGFARIAGAGEWSVTYQSVLPPPVPVPWYVEGALGLEFDVMLNINELSPLQLGGDMKTTPYLALTLGAGVNDVAGVEGTGKGGVDVGWSFPVPSGQNAITGCTAYLSVTGKMYVGPLEYAFPTKRWDLADCSGGTSSTKSALALPMLLSAPDTSPVTPRLIPRDYLDAPKPTALKSAAVTRFASTGQSYSVSTEPVVSATFPVSAAGLSSAGSSVNLLWLADNPSRNSANRTMVMHKTYDGAAWSVPVAVADNGTADFNPASLTFSDGTIVASWEDAKTALADSATLDEMMAQLEISAAIYDPAAKTWGSAVRLTDNATLDRTPKLAGKSGNNLLLTWIANSQNDLSGSAARPNSLYYALYNGSTWSAPQVAAVIPYAIKRYATVYDGTTANVVLSLDTDGDSSTIADLELYRLSYSGGAWGPLTRLTTDSVIDDNPQLALDPTNDVVLTWVRENELSSVVNFAFDQRTVIRAGQNYSSTLADYRLATATDGKVAIIYAGISEGSTSDLFALMYDPIFNLWGAPKQLTADPETEMRPTIAFLGTETIVAVFNRKLLLNPNGTPTTGALTDLYMLKHSVGNDLALAAGSLKADPAKAAPGSGVTLTVTAQNLGDTVARNIPVTFYNGDPGSGGALIGSATIGDAFKPGDSQDVSVAWTIPVGTTPVIVYAVIDPNSAIDTLNRANNITGSTLALPDYYLQGIRWEKSGARSYLLTIPVVNIGATTTPAGTLTLRLESETGALLTTIPVAPLARLESVDYTYTLDVSALPDAQYTVVAVMDEAGVVREIDEYNNNVRVVIPPDTVTLAVVVSGTGGGTVTSDPQGTSPVGIACMTGACSTTFTYGTIVNLLKTPDMYSTFGGWGIDCTGVDTCTVAMVGPKNVSATFSRASVAKNITANTEHATLSDALVKATSGAELRLLDIRIDGAFTLDKSLTLKGGWDTSFTMLSGVNTVLNGGLVVTVGDSTVWGIDVTGGLTVKSGSLTVDGVSVK